jgi:serine protease Do
MRKLLYVLAAGVLSFLLGGVARSAESSRLPESVFIAREQQLNGLLSINATVTHIKPGVVNIKGHRGSVGTGFIINSDGLILTNKHLVEADADLKVIVNHSHKYPAKIINSHPRADLALLKIEPRQPLMPLTLGDSDQLGVGDWVIAVGNPFGLGVTATIGIISADGEALGKSGQDKQLIQIDAAINPGNSGGPLLNLQGEVVAVGSALIGLGQGLGFAIPINLARDLITASEH